MTNQPVPSTKGVLAKEGKFHFHPAEGRFPFEVGSGNVALHKSWGTPICPAWKGCQHCLGCWHEWSGTQQAHHFLSQIPQSPPETWHFHPGGIPCSQSRRQHRSARRRQILQTPGRSSTTSGNPDRIKSLIIPYTFFSPGTASGKL